MTIMQNKDHKDLIINNTFRNNYCMLLDSDFKVSENIQSKIKEINAFLKTKNEK